MWCFGCNAGGSVIDFVSQLYGLNALDAAKKLDADFGLHLRDAKPDLVAINRWKEKKDRREAELRYMEEMWHKNIKVYRKMVQRFHASAPGPDRADIMAKLAYMDYWFEDYEQKLKAVKNCNRSNLHTQRKIS